MTGVVKINDTDLQVIEYRGQRVATLAQVDSVHERPEGTARKRFNDHREHFIEGEDFIKLCASEIRTRFPGLVSDRATEDVTLMFESGYLMLVKSFTDELAWKVQRQIVSGYFRTAGMQPKRASVKPLHESGRIRAWLLIGKAVASVRGVKPEIAMSVTLDAIEKDTGMRATDLRLALPGATVEKASKLNPTRIGEKLGGKTAKAVNLALVALGFMVKGPRDNEITEVGKPYGEMVPYTRHGHSGYQPLWHEAVIEPLMTYFAKHPQALPQKSAARKKPTKMALEPQAALL